MKTKKPSRAADKLSPIVLLLLPQEVRHILDLIDGPVIENTGRWDEQTDKWTYPGDIARKIRKQNKTDDVCASLRVHNRPADGWNPAGTSNDCK